MTESLDAGLDRARGNLCRLQQLDGMLRQLQEDRKELEDRVQKLGEAFLSEQQDVKKLEGASLTSLYYTVIGGLNGQLDQEKREALYAKLQYDSALESLDTLKERLKTLTAERAQYQDCQAEYDRFSAQKLQVLTAQHGTAAEEIASLQDKLGRLKIRIKETDEALDAGSQAALRLSRSSSLMDKRYWGAGGLKYAVIGQLNTALVLSTSGTLQSLMREFAAQLEDVKKTADINKDSVNYSKYASVLYEKLFRESVFGDAMAHSYDYISQTKAKVGSVMQKLRLMKLDDLAEVGRLEQALSRIAETEECSAEMPAGTASQTAPPESREAALNTARLRETDIDKAILDCIEIQLSLERVLEYMRNAEKWGLIDTVGGFVPGALKYSFIDTAKAEADQVQRHLISLNNALNRLLPGQKASLYLFSPNEFLDIYLDCLATDMAAQLNIMDSVKRLNQLNTKIEEILQQLQKLKADTSDELTRLENNR
jgi:hypothetical protein